MTYLRSKATIEQAVTEALEHLSPREIEKATGLQFDTVQRYTRPTIRTNVPAAVAAQLDAALIAKGESPVVMKALQGVFQNTLANLGGPKLVEDEIPGTGHLRKEMNEYLDVREAAVEDGTVDDDELEALIGELHDVVTRAGKDLDRYRAIKRSRSIKAVEG